MMKMASVVVGLALALTWPPAVVLAQQERSDWSLTFGTRTWVTAGYSTWNFAGAGVNVLSDLRWRGVESYVVPEVNADLVWKRLVLMSSVGGGWISDGVLIDEDFALNDRRGRFSRTRSSVDDSRLFYANADAGARIFTWRETAKTSRGYLDLLVGYQYWHEKYVAFGATGILDLNPFDIPIVLETVVPSNVKALTHDYFWHSLRVGVRYQVPSYAGVGFKAKVYLLPWSWFELRDVHHLRDDLKQNPSFSSEAEGGFGVQLDGALTYTVWKGLSIEVGYQYWGINSGEGDKFTHSLTGTTKDKLNEGTIERHGPYLGVQYRF